MLKILKTSVLTLILLIITSSFVFAWDPVMELINNGRETPVYRLYSIKTGEHLFTADTNEYNTLSATSDWNGEGEAWYAPVIGDGVVRLYHTGTNSHLYTTDMDELSNLLYDCITPWIPDNKVGRDIHPIFYSGGNRPIFRLYNPRNQQHLLTADENEYNLLG